MSAVVDLAELDAAVDRHEAWKNGGRKPEPPDPLYRRQWYDRPMPATWGASRAEWDWYCFRAKGQLADRRSD